MNENSNGSNGSNGGTGGDGSWPNGVDSGVLIQFAGYFWDLKRSLTAAAFSWDKAGPDERAAYLDQLAQLRKKERQVWASHVARRASRVR